MGNLLDALQPYEEDEEREHEQRIMDAQFARFHSMGDDEIKSAILNDHPERAILECFIYLEGSAVLHQWLEAYSTEKQHFNKREEVA